MKKLRSFTLREQILIALIASISIITKPVISYFSNSMTSVFGLPGGIVGGFYYMFWLIFTYKIIRKPFSIILLCVMQAVLAVLINNIFILKAFTYIPPGIAAEIVVFLFNRKQNNEFFVDLTAAALANLSGAISTYLLFFSKNAEGLLATIVISAISGGVGGAIANMLFHALESKMLSFKNFLSHS